MLLSLFSLGAVSLAWAEGAVLEIEGATIRGNQELPTVLYVVPWKPAKVYSLEKPEQSLASSRPLELIERDSFRRMLTYHQQFLKSHHSGDGSE